MGGNDSIKRLLLVLLATTAVVLPFQNCTNSSPIPARHSAESDSQADVSAQAGGDGYEGKVFVELSSEGCQDGSTVKSRIEFRGKGAFLSRENCKALSTEKPIDTAVLQSDSPTQFVYQDVRFLIESVAPNLEGIPTPGLAAGDFAPSINRLHLGEATALQAAALDDQTILAVVGRGPMQHLLTHIDVYLFAREGMNLRQMSEQGLAVSGVEEGFYIDPLANLAVLSASRAVLFIRSYRNGEAGFQLQKIERNSASVAITEGPFIPSSNSNLSGHPIDHNRLLLAYTSNDQLNYRVFSFDSSPGLGPILQPPGPAMNLALSAPNHPAILKTNLANEFLVFKANSGLPSSELSKFLLRVDGNQLTLSDYQIAEGFGERSAAPMVMGDVKSGVLFFQAMVPDMESFYHWATIKDGEIVYQDAIQLGNLRDEWPGITSMGGSDNLKFEDKAYVRLPSLGDDRIHYFDVNGASSSRLNLHLTNSWRGGTGRLFRAGDKLLFGQIKASVGSLWVVSTPSAASDER